LMIMNGINGFPKFDFKIIFEQDKLMMYIF